KGQFYRALVAPCPSLADGAKCKCTSTPGKSCKVLIEIVFCPKILPKRIFFRFTLLYCVCVYWRFTRSG
ncbi:MAG TPA: hypothetical protein PL141_09655, partial [Thermoflexales bacterium]|nr:hypothetical protein [Thermoflexales bacterium]